MIHPGEKHLMTRSIIVSLYRQTLTEKCEPCKNIPGSITVFIIKNAITRSHRVNDIATDATHVAISNISNSKLKIWRKPINCSSPPFCKSTLHFSKTFAPIQNQTRSVWIILEFPFINEMNAIIIHELLFKFCYLKRYKNHYF